MSKKKKIVIATVSTVVALFLIIIIATFTICKVLLNQMFDRVDSPDYSISTMFSADEIDIEKREIEFDSNGNTLRGYVWGDTSYQKLAVFSHGIGDVSNGYYPEMKYFVENSYRVLTFDNSGTGKSDGKSLVGLSQSAVDLHNALLFTEQDDELKDLPVYLFGHSWGGHAVTAVLNYEHKNVKAVASVAGYNSNGGIMLEWMKSQMGLGGFANVVFPFAAFWAKIDAKDAYNYTSVKGINKNNTPVLIVQGGKDDIVWTDSLYNHRKEITNEKVEYFFKPDDDHNGILSPEGEEKAYQDELFETYNDLKEQYNGNVPEDVKRQFFSQIDKTKYNAINHTTIDKIAEFFERA